MLKIKDDFDLKGLEKFGFEEFENSNGSKYYVNGNLTIYSFNREFDIDGSLSYKKADLLYQLIKSGIVEKVDEEGE